MDEQSCQAVTTARKDLGSWRNFRRRIRFPGRILVGLVYVVALALGIFLLVCMIADYQSLGVWVYLATLAFVGLSLTSVITYEWRRKQIVELYQEWAVGAQDVNVLYLELLTGDLSLVYTATNLPTAMLPVTLARQAETIDMSPFDFIQKWQRTVQTIVGRQFIGREEILNRILDVTRPFDSISPVYITTQRVQRRVALASIADGQIVIALGIKWHKRILFFRSRLPPQPSGVVLEPVVKQQQA